MLWACVVTSNSTALVVRDAATRTRLAGYLSSAGIRVSEYEDSPPMGTAVATAVWVIAADEDPASALALLGSWLGSGIQRRAIVVTRAPSSVRTALHNDEDRLQILIPPVFPWQLVDAVRATREAV